MQQYSSAELLFLLDKHNDYDTVEDKCDSAIFSAFQVTTCSFLMYVIFYVREDTYS